MLHENILHLYRRLRLESYRRLFRSVKERDGSLSATEAFSADVIHLLGEPTLSQFAQCLGISQPNATYKVNSLVSKGYVEKAVPDQDRREIRLKISEKFRRYYDENRGSLQAASAALEERFTPQELQTASQVLEEMLRLLPDSGEV